MQALPETARSAWQAYEEMLRTKDAHFSYLEHLEEKYRQGGRRTLAESTYLDQLLAAHDGQVKTFRHALTELARADLAAHQALIEHLTAAGSNTKRGSNH